MSQNKNHIKILIISTILLMIGGYSYHKSNRWAIYYRNKLEQPAREFVVQALNNVPDLIIGDDYALDVGCGIGHEALLLLKKNYQVFAVDNEKIAFDIMLQRPEFVDYKDKIHPMISSFQKIDFSKLPQFNIVVASFALPFCPSNYFSKFWDHITDAIKPDGYFIGNTFDPGFMGFAEKDRKNMTFHTKEQTLDLFIKFNIISFDEVVDINESTGIINQYYVIVAQKQGDAR